MVDFPASHVSFKGSIHSGRKQILSEQRDFPEAMKGGKNDWRLEGNPLLSCSPPKHIWHMGVSKNRGKTPKMDGENNGKPY